MSKKRTINVLWTGGLDSTCRIAQLSQMNGIIIQPYYIIDPGRKSVNYELKAMKNITEIIQNNTKTIAKLNDVILVELNGITANEDITLSYKSLHDKYKLGSQYEFLARYAKQHNVLLEVGLECSPRSKAYNTIISECGTLLEDNENDRFYIDNSCSTVDGINLFENLRFPKKLWKMSKLEEVEFMNNIGLNEIILKTHFCHNPIWGMTCGQCNPCKDALNEGMAFRVSKLGRVLGTFRKYLLYGPKRIIRRLVIRK